MRFRLLVLCLGLVAVPAVAGLTDASACSRHSSRGNQSAWAAADQPQAGARAPAGLGFSLGATFPL